MARPMPLLTVSCTALRAEPPWPNQVITKNNASAIINTAQVCRQKPPGSSCSGLTSLADLVVVRRLVFLDVFLRFAVGIGPL